MCMRVSYFLNLLFAVGLNDAGDNSLFLAYLLLDPERIWFIRGVGFDFGYENLPDPWAKLTMIAFKNDPSLVSVAGAVK